MEEEGILSYSFYEASNILMPKLDKDSMKKENYRPIILMHLDIKILNEILANYIWQCIKKFIYYDKMRLNPDISI